MIKYLALLSIFNASITSNYSGINAIEFYHSNKEEKKITFDFSCDYINTYNFDVYIEIYNQDEELEKRLANNIKIIGNKKASTKIDIEDNIKYVLIDIISNNQEIVSDVKFNIYRQTNCYLNKDNNYCNPIFMSKFDKGIVYDKTIELLLEKELFNKYLPTNVLDISNIKFHSLYNFQNNNMYLLSNKKLPGYEIFFNEKYVFPLTIKYERNNVFSMQLLNSYYVNLVDFSYTEQYKDSYLKTNNLILPFNKDTGYHEFEIVIDSFIDIHIFFEVLVNGDLYGECSNSKFCLVREQND